MKKLTLNYNDKVFPMPETDVLAMLACGDVLTAIRCYREIVPYLVEARDIIYLLAGRNPYPYEK